jgi:hypothetical protein
VTTQKDVIVDADHKGADLFFTALTTYYDLRGMSALDMFARDGDFTDRKSVVLVQELDLWEINPEHTQALNDFKPREVRIGCSYASLKQCQRKYDLVVVDSPQGVYPDYEGKVHAEHFDLIEELPKILKDRAIVVLYVNKEPYNRDLVGDLGYDKYDTYNFDTWMEKRERFYGKRHVSEADALFAYRYRFALHRFRTVSVLVTPCLQGDPGLPPTFRLAMELVRS